MGLKSGRSKPLGEDYEAMSILERVASRFARREASSLCQLHLHFLSLVVSPRSERGPKLGVSESERPTQHGSGAGYMR